jgi:hypothetical protein
MMDGFAARRSNEILGILSDPSLSLNQPQRPIPAFLAQDLTYSPLRPDQIKKLDPLQGHPNFLSEIPFNFRLSIQSVNAILATKDGNADLIGGFAHYCLLGYVSVMNFSDLIADRDLIAALLRCLSSFKGVACQRRIDFAFLDILGILLSDGDSSFLSTIFPSVWDFYDHLAPDSIGHAAISHILERLIELFGLSATSIAGQFCSIVIDAVSGDHVSEDIRLEILNTCRTQLLDCNEVALNLISNLKGWIDSNHLAAILSNLPSTFLKLLQSHPSVVIRPPAVEFVELNSTFPRDCSFDFSTLSESQPDIPESVCDIDVSDLGTLTPLLHERIGVIGRIIVRNPSVSQTFLEALTGLISSQSDSDHAFDHVAVFVDLWTHLVPNPALAIDPPALLFHPRFDTTLSAPSSAGTPTFSKSGSAAFQNFRKFWPKFSKFSSTG